MNYNDAKISKQVIEILPHSTRVSPKYCHSNTTKPRKINLKKISSKNKRATFNFFQRLLEKQYSYVMNNGTKYYLNKEGLTVATNTGNLIVMYFSCSSYVINNHHNTAFVAVAKDFVLLNNYKKTIADVIIAGGLCGALNNIVRIGNQLLEEESSQYLTFDKITTSIIEPYEIIHRGILDSPQFETCNLDGALIDVMIKDATGSILSVPYIVGKGVVTAPKSIGTLGTVYKGGLFHLNNGFEFKLPKELYKSDFLEISYGVLSVKTNRRTKKRTQFIQPKDYIVYSYLRKDRDFCFTQGFYTAGSAKKRGYIEATQNGTNYHRCIEVSIPK